jgi:hypothetical protein
MRAIGNNLQLRSEVFEEVISCCSKKNFQIFKKLCSLEENDGELSSLIGHDVPRTFHRLELFVNPNESFTIDLIRVLKAFAKDNGLCFVFFWRSFLSFFGKALSDMFKECRILLGCCCSTCLLLRRGCA